MGTRVRCVWTLFSLEATDHRREYAAFSEQQDSRRISGQGRAWEGTCSCYKLLQALSL